MPQSVEVTLINDESVPVDVATVVPNADGTWSATVTVPGNAQPGVFLVAANCDQYNAGEVYLAQSVSVQPAPVAPATTVTQYRGPTSAPAGSLVTLSASVKAGGVGVAGVPVKLTLGTSSIMANSNTSGIARAIVTAPSSGSSTASASFAGNTGFAPSSTAKVPFSVTGSLLTTKLTFTGVHTVDEYSPAALNAKLTQAGTAVAGRAVTFSTGQGALVAAYTNASGVATVQTSLATLGTNSIGLIYNGGTDTTYASSSATGSVTVTPQFVPGGVACATKTKCAIVGSNGETRLTTNGGSTWVSVAPVTTATLNSVTCPSATVCVAVGTAGTVLTSANGGTTWTAQPAITTQSLSVVRCKGVAACVAVGASGVVFTSANGGSTWTAGVSGTTLNFDALSCPTTTACLATANGTAGSATLASTNAGASWSTKSASEPTGPISGQDRLWCTSASTCLESSSFSGVYRTTDTGQIWTYEGGVYGASLSCKSATSCLGVGSYGEVGMSSNGGVTWTEQYLGGFGGEGPIQDVTCLTTECVAVSQGAYGDATANSSADGGTTWTGPAGL